MNKFKENTIIKSTRLINKENQDTKKYKINENINNNNNEQNKLNNNKIQQIKNNEKINNNKKIKKKEEQKYFEFHAHFKYSELVDALNKLKTSRNESTSNTSNANINNNTINDKNDINYVGQKVIFNNIEINQKKNNRPLNKSKPRNHKVVSRNVQMNNYIKYLGYIEECKDNNNNLALSSISNHNNIQQNKTSLLPQTDLINKRINENLINYEQNNQLNNNIVKGKILNEIKKEEQVEKIEKDNKINSNQKKQNLISISLANDNNNIDNKKVLSNFSHQTKNINKNENNNQINKKVIKKKVKNPNNKIQINNLNNINSLNNKVLIKINKEESINNSKIQLKGNNLFLNNININSIGNKFIKNKKIKNNIPNINCDLVGEKRKAHSSSISKNKKTNNILKTKNIINNLNNINNMPVTCGTTNKMQNTLNSNITTTNRIKPVATKSFQTNKINIALDNKNSKMKIITLNYVDVGKIKNKIIKKSINSFGISLCKNKETDKTKSKSNSKSNSKNKISNGKLLTDKNEKYDKNNLYKNNNRINSIQKEKTFVNKMNNLNNINENLIIDTNKSLSKNNLSRFNKTHNKDVNIIDSQSNINNNNNQNNNNNKKKGINLVFNGQLENKNGNIRINSIIYNINKNNKNLNINNSNYNLDKNNKLKGNIINSNKKNNNIIRNNPKINSINNPKNNNKNKINSIVTIINSGNNNNITYKKNEGIKKTKKIII